MSAALAPGTASAAAVCPDMGATSWTNASGGSWDDSTNWSNGVPGLSCTVSITLAGTYTVDVPIGGGVKTLTLGAASGTQTLRLLGSTTTGGAQQDSIFRADGTVTVGQHGVLQYSAIGSNPGGITSTGSGTIVNSGIVRTDLGSGAGTRDIQNNVTNNSGGVIALHTSTSTCGCGGTHLWSNAGTITTDAATTSTFTGTANGVQFSQSGGTVMNKGRMEIGGGYTHTGGTTTGNPIEICGSLDGPANTAATFEFHPLPDINCGGGGSSQLTGDIGSATSVLIHSESGGVISSVAQALTNRGTITIDGGPGQGQLVGQPFTNAGTLNISPASGAPSTHITSAFTNRGRIVIAANDSADLASKFTQSAGEVTVGAGATFSANNNMAFSGGTIANSGTFTENGQLDHTGGSSSGHLIELCGGDLNTPGPGNAGFVIGRISNCSSMGIDGDVGAGSTVRVESTDPQIDVSTGSFANHGAVTVVSDPTHLVQLHGSTLTNFGTLDVTGSNLVLGVENHGAWNVRALSGVATNVNTAHMAGGTSTVDGTLNIGGDLPVTGGVVQGTGTIAPSSTVTNTGGTVHPGHSPGILSITGNYTQTKAGTLAIAVAGRNPGSGYSRLAVSGTATIAGTLHVTTTRAQTGTLPVVTAAARTGTFGSKSFSGEKWSVSYNATGINLKGTAPPTATAKPKIHGTSTSGKTLTATTGTFTGRPTKYAYRWLRCSSAATKCNQIANATHRTYVLVRADVGHRLRVRVTATGPGGRATATSDPTRVVMKPS
jgi:hypothetical protein